MKVTFAVCADRAVGFGAAFVGLALLVLTARHLFAPVTTIAPSRAYDVGVPVIVAHAAVARPAVARRSLPATVRPHAAAGIARDFLPRAAVRAVAHAKAPASAHGNGNGIGTRRGTVARNATSAHVAVRASHAVAYLRAALHPIVVERRAGLSAPARVAPTRVAPSRVASSAIARSRISAPGNRRADASRSQAPSHPRPRVRSTAPAAFRMPARFDVRPALVTVPDAAVAALPTADALPTIDARKRRR